jgi:hypothetical protein
VTIRQVKEHPDPLQRLYALLRAAEALITTAADQREKRKYVRRKRMIEHEIHRIERKLTL